MKHQPLAVCLLTDDLRYGFSMHSLLSALRPHVGFHLCRSEKEMVQYMRGVGIYGDRDSYALPNLLLLDTSHPKGDDLFVLQWMRERPRFQKTPVVILAERHHGLVKQAFDLGANACAVLRNNLNSVCEIIDGVGDLQGILQFPAETTEPERKPNLANNG